MEMRKSASNGQRTSAGRTNVAFILWLIRKRTKSIYNFQLDLFVIKSS